MHKKKMSPHQTGQDYTATVPEMKVLISFPIDDVIGCVCLVMKHVIIKFSL